MTGFTVIRRGDDVEFRVAAGGGEAGGRAPLTTFARSSGLSVAFLGRLYHRGDLAAALTDGSPGPPPAACATSDATLALAAYRRFGTAAFERLEGDFALAVWDADRRALLGARDPLGGYPLFFAEGPRAFALGTGMGPLLDLLPGRSLDLEFAADFLMLPGQVQEIDAERTAYRDIHRVRAGQFVRHDRPGGRVVLSTYWDWAERVEDPGTDRLDEVAEGYGDRLRAAVAERVRGRTAAHLSGGMDSTSVALLADACIGQGRGEGPLHAISLIHRTIPGLGVENPYIELGLSRLRNARTHLVDADVLLDFDSFSAPPPHDEPFAGLRRIGLDAATVDAAAGCGARTLLTGIGADEMLVMSPWHVTDLIRRGRWVAAWGEIRRWSRVDNCSPWTLLAPYALTNLAPAWTRGGLGAALRGGRADWRRQNEWTIAPWISRGFAARYRLRDRSVEAARRAFDRRHPAALAAALHMIRSRLGDVDRWSLGAPRGVEIAHPFLDARVLRYGLGMQVRLRPRPEGQKPVLAHAMRGVLPEEIVGRRRKCDFSKIGYLGLARNLAALEALVHDAPTDDLGLIDKPELLRCLNRAALGVASGVDGMHRLNLTLAFLRWLTPPGGGCRPAPAAGPSTPAGPLSAVGH